MSSQHIDLAMIDSSEEIVIEESVEEEGVDQEQEHVGN